MTVSEDDPLINILDIVLKLVSVQYILSSVLSKSSAAGRLIECAIGTNLALVFDLSRDSVYIWLRLPSAKSNIF